MIRDANGEELLYWPITGLKAGEDSDILTIYVDTPQDGVLRATSNPKLTVFGRREGGGAFVSLSSVGLDLSTFDPPEQTFEIYATASESVVTTERVALSVGAARSEAALYLTG